MAAQPDNNPNLTLEYSELGAYLRHYSTLRFAMLTVYFAVVGGLGAVALGVAGDSPAPNLSRWAAIGATLVTAVFFTFEVVCGRYIKHFRDRLKTLETDLKFSAFSERPTDRGIVEAATGTLYLGNLVFWLWFAIFPVG